MKAKVISAFPACGKTTYYKEWSQYSPENAWRKRNNGEQVFTPYGYPVGEKIIDSDSSEFSWVKDENGNNTKERNPGFPNNYIQHIKDNLDKQDIIFVSSHEVVRKALEDNGIEYHIFYPDKSLKEEWIRRFKERGNDEKFIEFISTNWDKFIDDIESETYPIKHKLGSEGISTMMYINSITMSDVIQANEYEN